MTPHGPDTITFENATKDEAESITYMVRVLVKA
jgi:hypothetical protein